MNSGIILYSVNCPCLSCANKIIDFAKLHPKCKITIAYEEDFNIYNSNRITSDIDVINIIRGYGIYIIKISKEDCNYYNYSNLII